MSEQPPTVVVTLVFPKTHAQTQFGGRDAVPRRTVGVAPTLPYCSSSTVHGLLPTRENFVSFPLTSALPSGEGRVRGREPSRFAKRAILVLEWIDGPKGQRALSHSGFQASGFAGPLTRWGERPREPARRRARPQNYPTVGSVLICCSGALCERRTECSPHQLLCCNISRSLIV